MGICNSVRVPADEVEPLKFNREDGIIAWMDCGGSNVSKINEQLPGIVKLVATTRVGRGSNAPARAEELGVPLVEMDFQTFERDRGVFPGDYFKALALEKVRKGLETARDYDKAALLSRECHLMTGMRSTESPEHIIQTREEACNYWLHMIHETLHKNLLPESLPMFAAGGMALLSEEVVEAFPILNVHPGDVTKYSIDGIMRGDRLVVGDGWIPPARALSAGHEVLYSSFHQMVHEMDAGPNFMRSYPLHIDYNFLQSRVDLKDKAQLRAVGAAAQEALKHIGDHVIAGATFQDIFDGQWGFHYSGVLAYNYCGEWYLAPIGITAEDHVNNNPLTPFQRDDHFLEHTVREFYTEVEKISVGKR